MFKSCSSGNGSISLRSTPLPASLSSESNKQTSSPLSFSLASSPESSFSSSLSTALSLPASHVFLMTESMNALLFAGTKMFSTVNVDAGKPKQ